MKRHLFLLHHRFYEVNEIVNMPHIFKLESNRYIIERVLMASFRKHNQLPSSIGANDTQSIKTTIQKITEQKISTIDRRSNLKAQRMHTRIGYVHNRNKKKTESTP